MEFLCVFFYVLTFDILFFGNFACFEKLKSRRRAPGNTKSPVKHLHNLGCGFHIYWKHEMVIWRLLYFQVRESPAPLNLPTPTPAPDHLLGGHNEVGGTIAEWALWKRVSLGEYLFGIFFLLEFGIMFPIGIKLGLINHTYSIPHAVNYITFEARCH